MIYVDCKKHGRQEAYKRCNRKALNCKKCRVEKVSRRRKNAKKQLVKHFGGKCKICGYDKCVGALVFHHIDPTNKKFGLSQGGLTKAYQTLLEETKKCLMVCQNCHSEIHAGLINIDPFV